MFVELPRLAWKESQLHEALSALVEQGGYAGPTQRPKSWTSCASLDRIEDVSSDYGFDALRLTAEYTGIKDALRGLAPGLVAINDNSECLLLVIIGANSKKVRLITPSAEVLSISIQYLASALRAPLEQEIADSVAETVAMAKIKPKRRKRVVQGLYDQALATKAIGGLWHLRPQPGACLWAHMRHGRLFTPLVLSIASYITFYIFWLLSWSILGAGAIDGKVDQGWMAAWGLCLVTTVPLMLLHMHYRASFTIGLGCILKRYLLTGAMYINTDAIKKQGVGQLLGRVIESNEFETLALSGGVQAALALVEIVIAAIVILTGVDGVMLFLALAIWMFISILLIAILCGRIDRWAKERIQITNSLVESMVGHRTRLAQENPAYRHDDEDKDLLGYLKCAKEKDAIAVWISLLPYGWLFLALGIISAGILKDEPTTYGLAIGIGATILVYRSLTSLAQGAPDIARAIAAWRKIKPLVAAAVDAKHSPAQVDFAENGKVDLAVKNIRFSYPDRQRTVLEDCNFTCHEQSRILLQGASGSGKSTLAMILTGSVRPSSGVLLLSGMDVASLGLPLWRKKVVVAPQFQENHIFMGPFCFNLLMGREWPPGEDAIRDAFYVCQALGLGDLLSRMPGGMMQLVGDTGWQLSHGEKSRVFIARTLLQSADLTILDESIAALDPENAKLALTCVRENAKALMVIAHP